MYAKTYGREEGCISKTDYRNLIQYGPELEQYTAELENAEERVGLVDETYFLASELLAWPDLANVRDSCNALTSGN